MPKPKIVLPPDEAAPNFDGFTKEAFAFLHGLKKNNNKEWFEKHRDDYEMYLRNPSKGLVMAMAQRFREHKLALVANPKTSMYRINRDIRFSKDKSPYKTHVGISFRLDKTAKEDWCGCYLGIEPAEKGKGMKIYAGGGAHMPSPPFLKRIRSKIADNHKTLTKLLQEESLKEFFPNGLEGESLKRMPTGYSEDHPMASTLKLKDFILTTELAEDQLLQEELPDILTAMFEAAFPVVDFLGRA